MLVKRIKEWITTVLGLCLMAGSAYMAYMGKITWGEFVAFLPVCIGLFWAKNSFITDLLKIGKGGAAVLLVVLITTSCRTPRHTVQPVLPSATSSSSTNTIITGGTQQQGYTKPDSASIKALMACDSLGNVYIRQIASLQMGLNVKPSVTVKDNYVYLQCKIDSMAVFNKWLTYHQVQSDTVTEVKYLPGEVVEKDLKWWKQTLMYTGAAALVILLIFVVKKFYNPFK